MRYTRTLFEAVKKTTGIWGIPVVENPRPQLICLYQDILKLVKERIPESAVYRQSVEALTQHRLKIVEENEKVSAIEEAIDAGNIEEVIMAAKDELELAAKVAEWKAWEPLAEPAPAGQWDLSHKLQ
ncbi:hypothetical protein H4219_005068 [Mycoemilia scoparia]|uniref:NADH dehydrogenase [ubiquinone] 1 alpha subcomplex subunit 5 n=1 Tax=Mycoemilia scoparia TaxID=417184 RepID=A0A9W8DQ14_9FUNG|nr:hypothetical protein H4219_005068 [Mycoemilia scoparia]